MAQTVTDPSLQVRIIALIRQQLHTTVYQSYYDEASFLFRVTLPSNIPIGYIHMNNLLRLLNKIAPVGILMNPGQYRLEFCFFDDHNELTKKAFKTTVQLPAPVSTQE